MYKTYDQIQLPTLYAFIITEKEPMSRNLAQSN